MSITSRHLFLLLCLQLHGLGGAGPDLALVPRAVPACSPERAVVPLALQNRQRLLAQITLAPGVACLCPRADTFPPGAPPWKGEGHRPVLGGSDLLYLLMSLSR